MYREGLRQLILESYNIKADYPWAKYPNYEVFRHRENKKWFAVIMDISKDKLGLSEKDIIDVVNLKCDAVLIDSLRNEEGLFPAYHMNKGKWITAALDGSASDEIIRSVLDMSYNATAPKKKKR